MTLRLVLGPDQFFYFPNHQVFRHLGEGDQRVRAVTELLLRPHIKCLEFTYLGYFIWITVDPTLGLVIADFAPSVHKAPARDMTILLIDSYVTDQRLMKEAIEVAEGRSVCVGVKSIDEAFEYFHDGWRADLILLAIDSNRNGLEIVNALKSDRICNSIPVAVLIEGPTPIEAQVVLDMGALFYLEKPFNFDEHVSLAKKLIDSVADLLSEADFRTESDGKRP